jgi:hypothetical protein
MAVAAHLVPTPDVAELQARLRDDLFNTTLAWRGVGCDEKDARCQAAAAKVAERNAPIAATATRDLKLWYFANILQDKMTSEELKATAAFMATNRGTGLAKALEVMIEPSRISPKLYQSMLYGMAARKTWSITPAAEEFFEATRELPRSQRRFMPPAPPPAPK